MIAMLDTKCIGNRIKALRLERGMTQNSFAEVLGVSFQAVSNWERGVAPPDLDNLVHVAAFFGVPVDDLLRVGDDGFFLGIDGGGTWTKFAVVTSDGHVVKELKREGCNPNDIGLPHTLAILCEIPVLLPIAHAAGRTRNASPHAMKKGRTVTRICSKKRETNRSMPPTVITIAARYEKSILCFSIMLHYPPYLLRSFSFSIRRARVKYEILHKRNRTIKYGKGNKKMITIEMENGKKIKLELYPEMAPKTVANFEKLVKEGFYNGLGFHRIIPGFMIQGGDPLGNGMGGSDERIPGEFAQNGWRQNTLKHTRGVISMARAYDPNSASSQFFIMHEDAPHLDGAYAAFGKVVEGMDTVDEIASVPTGFRDEPKIPMIMKSVTAD
jgi:peptidyl-prolyl cis-trans isomerase B (cyclophilin B)